MVYKYAATAPVAVYFLVVSIKKENFPDFIVVWCVYANMHCPFYICVHICLVHASKKLPIFSAFRLRPIVKREDHYNHGHTLILCD